MGKYQELRERLDQSGREKGAKPSDSTGSDKSDSGRKETGAAYKRLRSRLDQSDRAGRYNKNYVERTGSYIRVDSTPRRETAKAGLAKYEEDRKAAALAEEEKPWWQKMAEDTVDNEFRLLPGVNVHGIARDFERDTSYQEMDDRWDENARQEFGYRYAQDPEAARDYAAEYNDYLNRLEKQQKMEALGQEAVDKPWLSTAKAIGAQALGGIGEYVNDVAENLGRGRITERGTRLSPTEYAGAITGAISEDLNRKGVIDGGVYDRYRADEQALRDAGIDPGIHRFATDVMGRQVLDGKGLGDVYQLGTSAAQSMMWAPVAKFGGAAGQLASMVSYFGQAAASGVDDARARGGSNEQALIYGALMGLAEAGAEQIDIKQLNALDNAASMRELLINMAKQGVSEGLEEGVTSVVGTFADELVMQDKGQRRLRIAQYIADGMTVEEANRQAWSDAVTDALESVLGGMISGGMTGGASTALKSGLTNFSYRNVAPDSVMALVQEGMAAPEGSAARTMAQEYEQQLYHGKALNGVQIQRLAQELWSGKQTAQQADEPRTREDTPIAEPEAVDVREEPTVQEVTEEPVATHQESLPVGDDFVTDTDVGDKEEDVLAGLSDLGLHEEEARVLRENFRDTQIDPGDYAIGVRTAFQYGQLGIPARELERADSAASVLAEHQRITAYKYGRLHGQQQARAEQKTLTGKTVARFKNVDFDGDWSQLNDAQTAGIFAVNALGETLGIRYRFYESYKNNSGRRVYLDETGDEQEAPNGFYKDGVIHLDVNAGDNGQGTVLFTAAHEMTHFIREWSPEKFRVLADTLMEGYAGQGTSVENLIDEKIAAYRKAGREISFEGAFEEVVADSMETMLADGSFAERVQKLKQTDRTLWEKIRDWFVSLADGIRKAYEHLKPDSREGQLVAEMVDTAEKLKELFAEATVDAAGNLQRAEKNTAGEAVGSETKYSYAGRLSANADGSALNRAVEMLDQGVDKEEVRRKTGWFQGMDGKWRYEIDDSEMQISDRIVNYMRLGELMGHPKLYAAYPDLADISVVFQRLGDGVSGSYDPRFDDINLDYGLKNDPVGLKDALVHELQHAIQSREGFTRGATVGMWEKRLKQGFDSRKAADIRQAQETERELNRIQEQDPEFYRDMMELNDMTPDLPRGEVDWETLEPISDDPPEWKRYDARREELEEKYGDMKVWDMNDLLHQRERAASNLGRNATELYFDTAGEIEARDASNRRTKSEGQRKTSPPRLGNEDTVFAEGAGQSDQAIGRTGNNKPFVIVERDILDGVAPSDWVKTVTQNIRTKFPNGVTIGRNNIAINQKSRRELTYSEYMHRVKKDNPQVYSDKLRATDNLDEIIQATTEWVGEGLKHERSDNIQDFARGSVLIRIGNNDYSAEVVVGTKKNGDMLLYDVLNLQRTNISGKKIDASLTSESRNDSTDRQLASYEAAPLITGTHNVGETGGTTSTDSIARSVLNVKEDGTKSSIRDLEHQAVQETLQQKNEKLRKDVDRLKELVKLQRTVTNGTKFTKTSVEAAAGLLMEKAGVSRGKQELAPILERFYEFVAKNEGYDWSDVAAQTQEAVDWLLEHRKKNTGPDNYSREILGKVRSMRIRLNDAQAVEAANLYGSVNEFRKRMMGSVVISKDGTALDEAWQELAELYPGIFDPDVTDGDMPVKLAEIVGRLRSDSAGDAEWRYEQEMLAQELVREVYDSYWQVSNMRTFADVKQKEIDQLKLKHFNQMDKLRTEYREKMQELKDGHTRGAKQVRETRRKTEERQKLLRVANELNRLFKAGTDRQNVKEGMRDTVATALAHAETLFYDTYTEDDMIRRGVGVILTEEESQLFNRAKDILAELDNPPAVIDSGAYQKRDEKLKQQLREAKRGLKDVFARERTRMDGTTASEVLKNLCEAYKQLHNSEYSYIRDAYDEAVLEHLTEVLNGFGNVKAKDMTAEQTKAMREAYTMILTTVRRANKAFKSARGLTIEQMSMAAVSEVKAAGGSHKDSVKALEEVKNFRWNNLKPVYAFRAIGSETLQERFDHVRAGEDVWAKDVDEAKRFCREKAEKYRTADWDLDQLYDFHSRNGLKFQLNLQQMMSLYAYSKREQADEHLAKGGFVFDPELSRMEKIRGITVEKAIRDATAYNLGPEELGAVVAALTKEQKAFVDEMQEYLSTVMGAKGNEVSMELYGVKLFKEKHYFPLKSSGLFLQQKTEHAGEVKLKNSGFAKKTTPEAGNPVILSDFMTVWANHVNDMSMYHAFVLPLEDFNRVMNYQNANTEETDSTSVKAALQNAYGVQAERYISRLLTDLNGGARTDPTTEIIGKMMGKFKKGAVFASLSVVVQQPSAIGRAMAVIDPKYFGGEMIRPRTHDLLWEEVKKYAPVAMIKEMGYFDTNMGRSTVDFITAEEYSGLKEKTKAFFADSGYRDELLSFLPALADEISWCYIWQSVKRETAAKHKGMDPGSEEFLELAGKRFTEVIVRTQVYDSVLSRSANMRSKDMGMKMATAFLAEPTTSINMVEDALLQARRGDKKYARKAIGSVIASQILNACLVSIVYAMRDDDEDESYGEKYMASFVGNVVDSVNPLTYLPFMKDIVSIVQGYEVERSDMAVIGDLVNAWRKLGSDKLGPWEKVEQFTGAVAQMFGLPLKNILRDVRAIWQTVRNTGAHMKTTGSGVKNAAIEGVTGSKGSRADRMYQAALDGDTEYVERLKGLYKDESSARTAMTDAIRDALENEDITAEEAADHLEQFTGRSEEESREKVQYWQYKAQDPEGELGEATLAKYYEKVENSGISLAQYTEFLEKLPDRATREETLAVIQGMNLTRAQKDALYFAQGYAESKLSEAPWH